MKLGLISSAWLGSPVGTIDGIRKTSEIGFDTIDVFADPLELSAVERKSIRDTCRQESLPVISTVCVALGLSDFNTPVRRFHIDRAKRYLELGHDLDAKNLLLVVGEYIWQQEVIKPEDQWNWAVESVRELGQFAEPLGQEVAIELEPFHLSIVNDVPKMIRFLDDVNHPVVKANVDISHLALVHCAPKEVLDLKGRIAHAHLSDCDGKKHGDLPPGRGVVDFIPYLKALRDAGFAGAVSIELEYSPEPSKIGEWVSEAYRETDRLMRSLNIRN
ncbi:MAG TPA: sugar phosphate isomerase/epimerase [Bryobacteraceae bacterium]|jgi:sugar phosphate isomerase/epimerase|nr:sugar phosphate isomerase/epimerase [Bryobacteraceae bacterium]